VAFVGYLGVFWGDINTTHWLAAVVAVGAIWLFTLVNIAGSRETGVTQVITTVLKFVPLAIIGIVGLFYIDGGNFTPFAPAHGGFDWHINAAATLALWAFIGLESATVPAEEVKDAERTIPRATIFGTLATTLLYVVALVSIVGVLSPAVLNGSSAPFADAANTMWAGTFLGMAWGKWIALVAMAATLGALNGWILLTARVSLAAADDGLFPSPFSRVHGKRQTPIFGLVVSSVLVSGLVLYNWNASFGERFTDIVLLATWMTLIAYAYAAAAEVVLFFRERALFSRLRLIRDTAIASLAFAYSVWAIWGSGEEWLAKGFMLLLFGIPVFVWLKWRESTKVVDESKDSTLEPIPQVSPTNGRRPVTARAGRPREEVLQ
jgi:APA family basic amino acid/polyamine antiporter